jgi:hypothetical protein
MELAIIVFFNYSKIKGMMVIGLFTNQKMKTIESFDCIYIKCEY